MKIPEPKFKVGNYIVGPAYDPFSKDGKGRPCMGTVSKISIEVTKDLAEIYYSLEGYSQGAILEKHAKKLVVADD